MIALMSQTKLPDSSNPLSDIVGAVQLSTSSIHSWQQSLVPKTTRNKAPTKISNEALLKDVEQHPDDYMYERARRLGCSKSGIEAALKRLGISQKKDLRTSKSVSDKKSGIPE